MLFRRLLKGKGAPTAPVLAFYFVFGGAVALLLVMFLLGRLPELRIFNRRETHFLVLVATGGYGFWILRSLTMDALDFSTARLLFLTAPLAIGALSAFSREKADGRALFGLALGFVGCILLVGPEQHELGAPQQRRQNPEEIGRFAGALHGNSSAKQHGNPLVVHIRAAVKHTDTGAVWRWGPPAQPESDSSRLSIWRSAERISSSAPASSDRPASRRHSSTTNGMSTGLGFWPAQRRKFSV